MGEGLDSWRPAHAIALTRLDDDRIAFSKEEAQRRGDVLKRPPTATSNGGPSSYYDFPHNNWCTLNDLMEYKAQEHWLGYALHLKDVVKASFRFGVKVGADNSYDARKIVYSGLRLLLMIKGRSEVANFLHDLSRDPQFKPEHKE